ncbi:hypothetical protein PtrSN001A_009829, partial [Pyrenophora tritici-repentis]
EVWSERCSDAAISAPVRVTGISAPARVAEISAADRVAEMSLISVIRHYASSLFKNFFS